MSTTQAIFDITAPTYDADRAKLIPCYDAFHRRATDLIPAGATHILDLGAGTGILTTFVRSWYPAAHIHLMDFSAPMIDLAASAWSPIPTSASKSLTTPPPHSARTTTPSSPRSPSTTSSTPPRRPSSQRSSPRYAPAASSSTPSR